MKPTEKVEQQPNHVVCIPKIRPQTEAFMLNLPDNRRIVYVDFWTENFIYWREEGHA